MGLMKFSLSIMVAFVVPFKIPSEPLARNRCFETVKFSGKSSDSSLDYWRRIFFLEIKFFTSLNAIASDSIQEQVNSQTFPPIILKTDL